MKKDWQLFEAVIKKRNITCLVHFTETLNLMSILREGFIYSISNLKYVSPESYDFIINNDPNRIDNLPDYINLSIEFPNFYVFNVFRKRHTDPTIHWCILKINPNLIYAKDTLFSVTNASSYSSKLYGITGDINKFNLLFVDRLILQTAIGTTVVRERNKFKDSWTTDVQAEVLIKDKISYSDIIEICFESKQNMIFTKSAFEIEGLNTEKFNVAPHFFDKRILQPANKL